MSTKNFLAYGDAETLFTGVGEKIKTKQVKPTPISYDNWQLLTPQEKETGSWLVEGVPGGDLSARVSALESSISSLMMEVTTGSILDFALTLPTKKTTFISVGNNVTDTPAGAYYIGAVIRSAISDNQLTIVLVRPDNTSVYVHSYYGTWRSSWLQFTTTAVTQ